jgi:hypothetical protein
MLWIDEDTFKSLASRSRGSCVIIARGNMNRSIFARFSNHTQAIHLPISVCFRVRAPMDDGGGAVICKVKLKVGKRVVHVPAIDVQYAQLTNELARW